MPSQSRISINRTSSRSHSRASVTANPSRSNTIVSPSASGRPGITVSGCSAEWGAGVAPSRSSHAPSRRDETRTRTRTNSTLLTVPEDRSVYHSRARADSHLAPVDEYSRFSRNGYDEGSQRTVRADDSRRSRDASGRDLALRESSRGYSYSQADRAQTRTRDSRAPTMTRDDRTRDSRYDSRAPTSSRYDEGSARDAIMRGLEQLEDQVERYEARRSRR